MRDSFIFYRSFAEGIRCLDPEDQLKALWDVIDYALDDQEPEPDGLAQAIFNMARPQIDKNNKRYQNGCKGGRPKNQIETKPKPKHNQTKTKPKPNVNDNVNDNDNITPLNPPKGKRKTKAQEMQDAYDRYLPDHDFSNDILGVLTDWLEHKTEIKDPYTEIGMKKFLNKVDDQRKLYGDAAVVDIINDSISSGYKGVVWDRIRGPAKRKSSLEEWMNA